MKSHLIIALVGIAALMGPVNRSTAHLSDYTLTITGQCPGRAAIHWSGATPNRGQGIVFGLDRGKTVIPMGQCEGTVLGLQRGVWLVNVISTQSGEGDQSFNMGSCCCALFLQLVESGSCNVSNVAQLP